ncbi:monofunctional biosynthetic peptidoglycan transglycosylase [Chelativorans alearense]|uniref:monofunctional biosynthetic peptidoglycan transglycosylase n=1 Tax=Chelativorans alearense TaxID=2681495 RepID=UPI0013CFA2D3|nr:monofunctional biosynthetic peptidoglycan transglycosylase [Chelativorans alearense]
MVKGERRPAGGRRRKRSRERRWGRTWLRRLIAVLVILALLPFGLTLLYRVSWVHPVSTLMLADLATLQGYDRRWVSLDDMGTAAAYAVMMSEDGQFCAHSGVDWGALNTVVSDALSGERPRGASTIPMQTVKNLFLWSGRSYVRKVMEAPLALYFDAVVPKWRIMEIYLNIAEWGPNIYGVEAASQYHFGRPARDLSARQAALLAVTLPNPVGRNPARPSAGLGRLASIIERRAARAGAYVGCLD